MLVETETQVVLLFAARSKRNAHNKNSVLQGISSWLGKMSKAN